MSYPPEAVSVADAAKLAGCSRSHLYPHISSGELPSIRLGKRRVVRVEALRAWLASKEQGAGRLV